MPHAGGKIPDTAFETDRLFLNRLQKEGIAVPDGIVPEQRNPQVRISGMPSWIIALFLGSLGKGLGQRSAIVAVQVNLCFRKISFSRSFLEGISYT